MAIVPSVVDERIYLAAGRWVDRCLRQDGALFSDETGVWSEVTLQELDEAVFSAFDDTPTSFMVKLRGELKGASDAVIQLMAEVLYVHLLVPTDIRWETKRDTIESVLALMTHPPEPPADLIEALRPGFARAGVAYRTRRFHQLHYFVTVMRRWKALDAAERSRLLDDPWAFKAFLTGIPIEVAYAQREALLHLVHPDAFENIVSREHKRAIAEGLSDLISGETPDDVDQALLEIRRVLEVQSKGPVNFYDDALRARWDRTFSTPVDDLARWAQVFTSWPELDRAEYDYKLEVAEVVREARAVLEQGRTDWPQVLARVLRTNNLVNYRVADTFSRWASEHPEDARSALEALWTPDQEIAERIERFGALSSAAAPTTGARLSIASVLLLGEDPEAFPPFRSLAVEAYYRLARQPTPPSEVGDGDRYADYCRLLDTAVDALGRRGVELRGRLHAQALLWAMSQTKSDEEPIASLSPEQREEFLRWRGDVEEAASTPRDFPSEPLRRRRRLQQIGSAWQQEAAESSGRSRERLPDEQTMRRRGQVATDLLAELRRSGDVTAFANAIRDNDALMPLVRSGSHHLFVKAIGDHAAEADDAAAVLADAYTVPANMEEAVENINRLYDLADGIGKSTYPAAAMSPLAASAFWHMQDPAWVPLYSKSERVLEAYGWIGPAEDAGQRYQRYAELLMDAAGDEELRSAVVEALAEMSDGWFAGLDPSLVDRCEENAALLRDQPDEETRDTSVRNAAAVLADLKLAGQALSSAVGEVLDRSVHPVVSKMSLSVDGRARADGFVAWRVEGVPHPAPDIRVWVTSEGVAAGLYPGNLRDWYPRAWRTLAQRVPDGYERLDVSAPGGIRQLRAPDGTADETREFLIGRWLPGSTALGATELAEELVALAARLRPAVEALVAAAGGTSRVRVEETDDPLASDVRRFLEEREYPDAVARQNAIDRVELARALEPAALAEQFDLNTFRQIINTKRYGSPGPQSVLNSTLSAATPEELLRIAGDLEQLLWGGGADAARIDALLDAGTIPGLGEAVIMKLLAIAHPDRYLPVFPYRGPMGKAVMLEKLGLSFDTSGMTRGEIQVEANRRLRDRLDPFFPGDTFAMKEFLYWLGSQDDANAADGGADPIAEAATELHVEESFLRELVELLEEKRQIILYGPPGTGKTFLAKRLARALVEDESRYRLVQFHPSYSYEDFFEGYRPVTDEEGRLSYRLVQGPLARMVEVAGQAPGATHVMVIDEINRANLPKVFGELLFLLEYRDEPIHTQYRPDEPFSLPKKLYFIGTMNTADRSIALIDAALRRRFHFVPFFPHDGPMRSLLRRWLDAERQSTLSADLLDMVNEELRSDLGGPHLQVGPSYFMHKRLELRDLKRIWTYSVHPYIEEQLFGDEARIEHYTWDAVWRRFNARRGAEDRDVAPDEASSIDAEH